jgi:hypothetical protein
MYERRSPLPFFACAALVNFVIGHALVGGYNGTVPKKS